MKVNTTKTIIAAQEAPDRRVPVRLPVTASEDGVIEVGCNGRMYLIKRGETVNLPPEVAEILEHAGKI